MGRPAVPWAPHGDDGVGSVQRKRIFFCELYRNDTHQNPTLYEYELYLRMLEKNGGGILRLRRGHAIHPNQAECQWTLEKYVLPGVSQKFLCV